VLVLFAGVVAACGNGDNNGGSSSGNGLPAEDNLRVDQYRSDIEEFCNLSANPNTELYDRALVTVVASVDQLIAIYEKEPGATFHEALRNRDIKMNTLVQGEAKKLQGCGRDGKVQAAKLTQALQ
jgi:hypothetical protein